ncbi:MAG TPA: VOC family protein [Candidatus Binataceae bacterium]|nr:VOC family protein [Candidatus Binataceae bacterium]
MLDHMELFVSDLACSKDFYAQVLAPLDFKIIYELENAIGFGDDSFPSFWIHVGEPRNRSHFAFGAKDRTAVDAFYQAAIAAGGIDNGAPGIRAQYTPTYYAAFIFDPDGNNIEVVCRKG